MADTPPTYATCLCDCGGAPKIGFFLPHGMTTKLAPAKLETIVLRKGKHNKRTAATVCAMEAVAWLAGEPHTDHPECVSPVIGEFVRSWNDAMNDTDRQILKPLLPRLIGTRGSAAQESQRAWMALDWLCRVSVPAWLRLAGLHVEATAIEATAPIVDTATAQAAQEALSAGRKAAAAAWAAARDAAGDAAWAAAWAAAGAAARDAARNAARAAARDAAGDAAGAAAWAAARAAARAALRPTVEHLQREAFALLEKMVAVTES
jgi:hypothetical protein